MVAGILDNIFVFTWVQSLHFYSLAFTSLSHPFYFQLLYPINELFSTHRHIDVSTVSYLFQFL